MNAGKLFNALLGLFAALTMVAIGLGIYFEYINPPPEIPTALIVVVPGPPGPAGATGATGKQGNDGRAGATGAQGAQGNFWGTK